MGDLVVLRGELICERRPLNERGYESIYRENPLFTLGQTLTLIFFWASIWALI